jgi:predicted DNA-binding ribbon-helix-helix protein
MYTETVYADAMKRTNIYLTDRQHEELAKLAAQAEIPVAELIRRILDEALFKSMPNKSKGARK